MGDTYHLLLEEDQYAVFDTDDMLRFTIHVTEELERYSTHSPLNFLLRQQIAELNKEGFDFLKIVQTASRADTNSFRENQTDIYLTFFVKRRAYEIKNTSNLPKDKFGQPIWS